MKPNKLTSGSNVLFESSRFMLPQHRDSIVKQQREQNKKFKPNLDDQELDNISRSISESMLGNSPVSLVIFDEYEDIILTGTVTRIDQQLKRIKIENRESWDWVNLNDVIGIQ